MQTVVKRHVGQ